MPHTFTAHSALGEQLQFRRMVGREEMGRLFEFHVDLLSESDGIDPKSLLGTDLTVEIDLTTEAGGSGKRYLSGQVTAFRFAGRDGDLYLYKAVTSPWLWLATRRTDFKIFQNKTVPAIVEQVLAPYGFVVENKLSNSYRAWDYCVQYGEDDFKFISRLLEHEGAYYYFEHQMGSHKMILADDIGGHGPLPAGPSTIAYYPGNRAAHVHDQDYLDGWNATQDIASGKFAADDYDFTKPRALLDTRQSQPAGHSEDAYEVFAWPGGYTEIGDGQNYARVRIEQQKAERESIHGTGNARNLAPGYLFTLSKYPRADQNQRYLITGASYNFTQNVYRSDGGGQDTATTYRLDIDAVPSSVSWRSQCQTPKPHTSGPQTAVVVGPPGEEIYTDQYGRVKVQFHWDRYGQKDQNSSCWIRVSSPWAGSNYGAIHLPRIGQEVIVDFLNGDPDYPIITGRVYNAMQMPPWQLPANKTQSGIKSRSSKGGTPGTGEKATPGTTNIIRMEDQAGQEQLWFHAQKDQLTEVEHDEDKWVGQDRRKTIDRDEFNTIHRDRTEIVDRNEKINVHGWRTEEVDLDETITIHGNRTEVVDKNETITIHQNRTETVDLNETVTIHKNQTHTVDVNRTRKVGVDESVSIGSNRTKSIGKMENVTIGLLKTQSIGLAYMQNVGLVKMVNSGILYNLNVGMVMSTVVGISQSTNVGQDRSVSVGQNQTTTVTQNDETKVGKDSTVTVGETLKIHAKKIDISADQEITLTVGPSTIKINGSNIQVLSPLDRLNC